MPELDELAAETRQAGDAAPSWARSCATAVTVFAGLLCAWSFVSSERRPPLAWALVAVPWLAVGLAARWPAAFTFNNGDVDERASLGLAMLMPAIALPLYCTYCVNFLDFKGGAYAPGLVLGLALIFAVRAADADLHEHRQWVLFLILLAHGYGAAAMGDVLLDRAAPAVYRTRIERKVVTGGRMHHAVLHLAPWGPVREESGADVSWSLFHAVAPGDEVCVTLGPGALSIPWFDVARCPGGQP